MRDRCEGVSVVMLGVMVLEDDGARCLQEIGVSDVM